MACPAAEAKISLDILNTSLYWLPHQSQRASSSYQLMFMKGKNSFCRGPGHPFDHCPYLWDSASELPESTKPKQRRETSNRERLAKNQKKRLPSWPGGRKPGIIKNRQCGPVPGSAREGKAEVHIALLCLQSPQQPECARIPRGAWCSAHSVSSLHGILCQPWKSGWLGLKALSL